jgi:hypothetical protein
MNPLDDMFRDGLSSRKGEVPTDMWSRVSAGKTPVSPEGEGVDQYFSDALKDRAGAVPADMWSRIAATGVPAAATLDQVFADGLQNREGDVPSGMWDRIWKGRSGVPVANTRRFLRSAAIVLFLLVFSAWAFIDTTFDGEIPVDNNVTEIIAITDVVAPSPEDDMGSAAGAKMANEAGPVNTVAGTENHSAGSETQQTSTSQLEHNISEVTYSKPTTAAPLASRSTRKQAVSSSDSGTDDSTQASAEKLDASPANVEDEMAVADDLIRMSIAATPSLRTSRAISALGLATKDLEVKKRYQPKTPPANSFRSANRHRLQTEFLFGAFYANQQFTAETNTDELLALRTIRETRENPGLSYQVSLRGAYKLNERLVLRSGLTYSEIRNTFDYEHVVNGRLSLLKINNHIRQLEVPVLLGLHVPGRRLNVSINAGPLVNLTTSVQGRFLSPDSVDPLNLATEGQYRKNVGVGFMTSLSTTYVIGKKQPFVLLVEPFFKAYPGSFTRKGAPLKETYWAAGLQLGIRKGF